MCVHWALARGRCAPLRTPWRRSRPAGAPLVDRLVADHLYRAVVIAHGGGEAAAVRRIVVLVDAVRVGIAPAIPAGDWSPARGGVPTRQPRNCGLTCRPAGWFMSGNSRCLPEFPKQTADLADRLRRPVGGRVVRHDDTSVVADLGVGPSCSVPRVPRLPRSATFAAARVKIGQSTFSELGSQYSP